MFAEVNGTRIYLEDVGDGQPVLFSHGLLWNTSMYAPQVGALVRTGKYRCISYDHRGQGQSADADDDCSEISVEMLCEDVAALIRHLGLGAVHFVGHSLGGFVGVRLAVRYPEMVRSLVLCNTSGDEEPKRNLLKYRLLNAATRWLGPDLFADAIMPLIFDAHALRDPARRAGFRKTIVENRKTIWRACNGVINRESQFATLPKIAARTLVITANGDTARVRVESERLANNIPNARMICLERGAHMLPLEEPDKISELLIQFFAEFD